MSSQRSAKELMDEIQKNSELAKKRVDEFPVPMRQGAERRIRTAQDNLKPLKKEYGSVVAKNAVVLAVNGPGAADFAAKAKELGQLIPVNYNLLEDKILAEIKKANGTEIFGNYEYQTMLGVLNKLKNEYEFRKAGQMNLGINPFGRSTQKGVSQVLKSTYGELFHSTVAASAIAEGAFNENFTGKKVGVILYNNDGNVDMSVIPTPIMTVTAKEVVTEDEVRQTLSNLKTLLTKGTVGSDTQEVEASKEAPVSEVKDEKKEIKTKGKARGRPKKSQSQDQVKTEGVTNE